MKKILLVVLFVLLSYTQANAWGMQPNVTFVTLPDNSVEIGHYFARFCQRGVVWVDEGSITIGWFGQFEGDTKVHLTYIEPDSLCQQGHIILAARSGYHWQLDEPSFWNDGREGFILIKD